jgi:hypothetical protein
MKSFREAIRYSSLPNLPLSAHGIAKQRGISFPTSIRAIIKEIEVILLDVDIVTGPGVPLGGHATIMLRSDGSYTFKGHMRATGLISYNYRLQCFVHAVNGLIIAAQNTGSVFGSDSPFSGDREHSWEEKQSNLVLREQWNSIRNHPTLQYSLNAEIGGILGTAWDLLKTFTEAIVAKALLGPAGVIVVIGSELGAAAGIRTPPGVLAGVIVFGGSVLVFGPGVILPAFVSGVVVGAVVESDIKHRSMTPVEIEFATKVFFNTLPINRIILTNLSHDGRKYTIPSLDGTILVNLDNAYDDPINFKDMNSNSDYSQPGSVFIHELVHAWQIANTSFMPGLICGAGSSNYGYHIGESEAERLTNQQWSQQSWSEFNLEQQAHIVDDWYGAYFLDLNSPGALNDPAFHFIRDNIRARRA